MKEITASDFSGLYIFLKVLERHFPDMDCGSAKDYLVYNDPVAKLSVTLLLDTKVGRV